MGFISFQKFFLILLFVLLTCYYNSAFRLIHTSQQPHETNKESVKKVDEIKEDIESLQQKTTDSEERVKTRIISERKLKPVPPTLPDITIEKLRAKISKTEPENDSEEEDKSEPITEKQEPEKRRVIKITLPKTKEQPKIVSKPEPGNESDEDNEPKPILKKEEPEKRKVIKITLPKAKEQSKIVSKPESDDDSDEDNKPEPTSKNEEPERRKVIKITLPKAKEQPKIVTKPEPNDDSDEDNKPEPINKKEEPEKRKVIKITLPKTKEQPKIVTKPEPDDDSDENNELEPISKREKPEKSKVIKITLPKPKEQPKIVAKPETPPPKPKQEKVEHKKVKEENKVEPIKQKEEPKKSAVETKKPVEPKKTEIKKPVEEKKVVETKKPKEVPKPKEEKKPELKVEQKVAPKTDDKQPVPKQTKEQVTLAKKEEAKPIVFNSSITSLYFNLPSFSPNFNVVENKECKNQGHILIDQLNSHKIWALKMLDATAKIPSGILKGNLNQLGDYDQCVGIFTKIPIDDQRENEVKIAGKYCLASIDLEAEIQEMKLPVHLAQSRSMIRSQMKDPGHFIPRFTTIRWGLCIPAACSAEDAEKILEYSIKTYNESTHIGINFDVSVEADQCFVRKAPKKLIDYHYTTILTLGLTVSIGLLVLTASIRDLRLLVLESEKAAPQKQESSKTEKMLMSFSLKRTTSSLLRKDCDPDEIECIHGVRAICTFMLYIAHKLIPIGQLPFTNKTLLTETSNSPFSVILRLSLIYTDSFLLLSGILTSYSMSKDMEEKGSIPWFSRIVARFVRLTPSLFIIILYYAYVMDLLGDGPLWGTVVTANAELCKENWWRNILYIQNFYPFQEMCATHSHQLALDFQLSLIAPILVWLLYRKPLLGVTFTILLHSVSVILRYYATMNYRLSLVIYHGISISQLYRTANMLYASSIHRATPYIAGVGLGVLLRQIKTNFRMPKILLLLGWLVAGYFAGWALYSPAHLSSKTYKYDINEAAQFSALCPLAWALALSWLIFSCFADKQGFLNVYLSSRPMVIMSRISYTLYLTQFIVFFYNVGTVRSSAEFAITSSFDVTEFVIILIISTLLTLLVDMPVQKIKSIMLKSTPVVKTSEISPESDAPDKKEKPETVKKVTISDTVQILEDNVTTELNHKYRQLSTESEPISEPYSEDNEEIYDDDEIVEALEYKMRKFLPDMEASEPLTDEEDYAEEHKIRQTSVESQPSMEDVEDLMDDEEIVQHLESRMREPSAESQPSAETEATEEILESETKQPNIRSQHSTEEVEDLPEDEAFGEIEDNKTRQQNIQSQQSTVDVEDLPEDETSVKFVFNLRPTGRPRFLPTVAKEDDDEEIVKKLENNVRQVPTEKEPESDDEK